MRFEQAKTSARRARCRGRKRDAAIWIARLPPQALLSSGTATLVKPLGKEPATSIAESSPAASSKRMSTGRASVRGCTPPMTVV